MANSLSHWRQCRRLVSIATLSQQRSDVDAVRNQLKAEQKVSSQFVTTLRYPSRSTIYVFPRREKAEREQMTRRNRILSVQLAESQEQLQNAEVNYLEVHRNVLTTSLSMVGQAQFSCCIKRVGRADVGKASEAG